MRNELFSRVIITITIYSNAIGALAALFFYKLFSRVGCNRIPVIGQISNGNRTEWSPIRSVIIRVINKNWTTAKPNHEYDYRQNWTTPSPVTN